MSAVYPRTHGETILGIHTPQTIHGLSPYTRGNPKGAEKTITDPRSIPVHTGKPLRYAVNIYFPWVYPRTHGETIRTLCDTLNQRGLSPYTRGNRGVQAVQVSLIGSIPVHTGKPFPTS